MSHLARMQTSLTSDGLAELIKGPGGDGGRVDVEAGEGGVVLYRPYSSYSKLREYRLGSIHN